MAAPVSGPPQAANPYIGPTAFQTGDRLYGRDRELNQLTNLLVAERIVLLHSPSGAGKTSLIQAALIPRLAAMRFHVLPVVRVGAADAAADRRAGNRYLRSTLMCLTGEVPADGAGLRGRVKPENGAVEVLIFDQFEEILTLDPTDIEEKLEFFRELGEALEDPGLWALFAMREDYAAALAPYEAWVPGHFQTRFRLNLLGREGARDAIQRPAEENGVIFEDAAAAALLDDLRKVRVQQGDGSFTTHLGSFIEPVQLQVVCRRLWEDPRPDARRITPDDLAHFGEINQSLVDTSLADYYAARVKEAAASSSASERSIREWIDRQLITESGVRGQVLMGAEKSGGLENAAVRLLENAYLVRGERRGGVTWFELAHDRLIGPIRADNAAWFRANLSTAQLQAELWNRQGRPEGLLITGPDLAEARRWAAENPAALTPLEADFLAACEQQEARARLIRRRNRVIAVLAAAAALLAVLSGLAYRQAEIQRGNAERQARAALANQFAAQSQTGLEEFPLRSLLLAVEAVNATRGVGLPRQPAAEEALRAALKDPHGLPLPGRSTGVSGLAFSPDGRRLAGGGLDGSVQLWEIGGVTAAAQPRMLSEPGGAVSGLAFSPDGRWLAAGGKDPAVRLWNLGEGAEAQPMRLEGPRSEVISLAVSPDGRWLAAATLDQTAWLWRIDSANPAASRPFQTAGGGDSWALAFSPDGRWLAGSSGREIRLWDLEAENPLQQPRTLTGHRELVSTLAFSPDSRRLASGSRDGTARLWQVRARDPSAGSAELAGHGDWVNVLAFSPDGRQLATASGDKTVRLWDAVSAAELAVLRGHTQWVGALAFSPDGRRLASAGGDKTARVWDLSGAAGSGNLPTYNEAKISAWTLRGHETAVGALAFSPDGRWLATGSADGSARLWDMVEDLPGSPAAGPVSTAGVDPQLLGGFDRPVRAAAFSPDGRWLAAGGGDPAQGASAAWVSVWRLDGGRPSGGPTRLDLGQGWISVLAFDRQGRRLAAADGGGAARVWEINAAGEISEPLVLAGHAGWIWSLAFSPDGRRLITGSEDGTARLWDLQARDPGAGAAVMQHGERVGAVAFSPDGQQVATAGGFEVRLWDAAGGAAAVLRGHSDTVTSLAYSPDGRWLASASRDGDARLWDLRSGDPGARPRVLEGHSDWVNGLAFSPDGKWLATGSADQTARLWEVSGSGQAALRGHDGAVTSLAFSPDSKWLATGSTDGAARLWDTAGVEASAALRGHEKTVSVVAFSPDGKWLATGSEDQSLRLWITSIDTLTASACQIAGRSFTREEWAQFFPGREYAPVCP